MLSYIFDIIDQVGWPFVIKSLIICMMVAWYVRTYWMHDSGNLPPGLPRVPFPFHILLAKLSSKTPIQQIMELTKQHGDIVYMHIGGKRTVILGSSELVHEIMQKRADVTSGRADIPFMSSVIPYDKGGIIFSNGHVWTENRKFAVRALRSFGVGKNKSIDQRINEEARFLCDVISKGGSGGRPLDIHVELNCAVANIMASVIFGHRFEYSDEKFKKILHLLEEFVTEDMGMMSDLPLFLVRHRQVVLHKIRDMIDEEVESHAETFDEDNIRDIIDMYLQEMRSRKEKGEEALFNRDVMWADFFDMYAAGTDTTYANVAWIFLYVAAYPDIQEKIFQEIIDVIGPDAAPSIDDREKMPYTNAFINESLRIRPSSPFGGPHLSTADLNIRGYHVPKGTEFFANILHIQHDPKNWDEPDVFRPDRFLSADGKTVVIPNKELIPFGVGRRICVGEQLARAEAFLFLVNVVQRFSLRIPDGVEPDFGYDHQVVTLVPKPHELVIESR